MPFNLCVVILFLLATLSTTYVNASEKINLGFALIERSGCYGCHFIEKYQDWPKIGPNLEFIASKTTKEWAYHWIDDPKSIRFNTWMPSFFHQTNNSDPASLKRSAQEIHAIVEYLFANSKTLVWDSYKTGDPVKGKKLFSSLGCLACHQITDKKPEARRTRASLYHEFGANLIGFGSETTEDWIVLWLTNPLRYNPQTRVPDFRLNVQEASDIAAYLVQSKSPAVNKIIPPVDDGALNHPDPLVVDGRRLIKKYGCYSCHHIPGFEHEKPVGNELTEQDARSKESWFKQKLMDPRSFDKANRKETSDDLKMPNYNFTKEEAEAVTSALMMHQDSKVSVIDEGMKTIRQFNCQACHRIDHEGGTIDNAVTDWLVKYQGKDINEAQSLTKTFSPPSLMGEGQKVQSKWLFEFLHHPTPIRPWLHMRMPTFFFHKDQVSSIVQYFDAKDNHDHRLVDKIRVHMSAEELDAAKKLFSKDYFNCASCHIVGKKMPEGSVDQWAPNFALAAKRLKPQWIIQWIANPSAILPGTKMPTFYDPKAIEASTPQDILKGDARRQIKVLRDYLLTIDQHESEKN
ncbi:MAG: c-type cytochrome [Candidatus Omnitrophica bacterium]|nr:c-type cytochrome [Candidatus Omnitrophota bacterium]